VKPTKVRYSPKAEQDLREAWRHVAHHNVVAAEKLFDAISGQVDSLKNFPERGTPRPEFGADLRMLVEGKYLIFYRIVKNEVLVSRILHGSQDRAKVFT
jgi:toxin ParE1/3/4